MFDPATQSCSRLFADPSVAALVFRIANTESLIRVNFAGSIHFFENGGNYAELNPKDIRPFEKRIGKTANACKYPLLQIRHFTESHVLYLIALHTDTNIKAAFLDTALR